MRYLETNALPVRQQRADDEGRANALAHQENPNARVNRHHQDFMSNWWTLWRRRGDYLSAVEGMDRYIALTRVSSDQRMPIFSFVDGSFRIEDSMVAFPYADDYSLGILQSVVHCTWFRERCSTLETRLRYTLSTIFKSFPWPQSPTAAAVERVSRAAAAIIEHRASSFRLGYPLASQYDALRRPGSSELRNLHNELDSAVLNAYDFDPDQDLLTQIFDLNLLASIKESSGEPVTGPGPALGAAPISSWSWPAPLLPD